MNFLAVFSALVLIGEVGASNPARLRGSSTAFQDSASDWDVELDLNCYATGHGADENLGDKPEYSIQNVDTKEACVSLCIEGCASRGGVCGGCEFVVYDQSSQICYPKKGIHCDQCVKGDQASQYMLLAPPGQGCATGDWNVLDSVNCYAVGHGADENQGAQPHYSLTDVYTEDECTALCLNGCSARGGVCAGCEFVIYDSSTSTCYPKKGIHCDQCVKGGEASQFKLLAPPDVDITACAAR
jgi:hypothetical protein